MINGELIDLSMPGETPATLDADFTPEWQALLDAGDAQCAAHGQPDAAALEMQQTIWDLLQLIDRSAFQPGYGVTYFAQPPCDEYGRVLTMAEITRSLDAIGWAPCVGTEIAYSITSSGNGIY